jgi:hypothetical protein
VMLHVLPRHGAPVDPLIAVPRPLDVMFVVTWAYPTDKSTPAAFSSAANSTARK